MNLETPNPKQVLLTSRIIWGALFMGITTAAAVFAWLIQTNRFQSGEGLRDLIPTLFYIGIGLTLLSIPLGLFIRGQIFKSGWVGDVVQPQKYLAGNIVAWGLCEGPCFFGLIVCLLANSFWPYAIPPAAAFLFLLLLWPNGRAMFPPHEHHRIGER